MTVNEKTGLKESEIGKIPEDWDTISFDKAISHVVDNRGKTAPTSKNGIALIATNCIKENALYPAKEKIRYVSKETYENWFRDHPKPDDIIIVNKGTPGMVCLVPNPVDFVIAQDMVAVRPNRSRIYGRFLFAFMRSKIFKHEVDSLNVGTTIPHLKKTYFPLLTVPLPSKDEQIAIGDTYYNLSKKIEINLKMNETLEAIGQAVFKSWFVDFEFPNKECKPYKSSGGEMVNNELLWKGIPRGWTVRELGDFIRFTKGKKPTLVSASQEEGFLPQILIDALDGMQPSFAQTEDMVVIEESDIIMVMDGASSGRVERGYKGVLGSTLAVMDVKEIGSAYAYHFLKEIEQDINQNTTGTSIPHADKNMVGKYLVVVPDDERITSQFETISNSILSKSINNKLEIQTLQQIRDSLLPKLMSGKRVPITKENAAA